MISSTTQKSTKARHCPDWWHEGIIFSGLLSALLLTYLPVILTPYAFLDDYPILSQALHKNMASLLKLCISGGRPVQGLLLRFFFSKLSGISGLCWLRLMSVVVVACLAFAFYRLLVAAKWPGYQSALLAFIICAMPPFQVYIAWAVLAPTTVAGILSVAAGWLVSQVRPDSRLAVKGVLVGLAGLVLGVTFCIYQPIAMLYVVSMAITLFTPEQETNRLWRRLAAYGVVAGLGLGIGFIAFKYGQVLYSRGGERSALANDWAGKAGWFMQEALSRSLNLANLSVSRLLAFGVGIFILLGLLLYFRGSFKRRVGMTGLALVLLPIAYLPNLVTAENWASYRSLGAITALVVLYVFLALHGFWRVLRQPPDSWAIKSTLSIVALTCGLLATSNVLTLFAWPQQMELQLLRSQLRQQDLDEVDSIYFIRAHWSDSIAWTYLGDEFGIPSSSVSYVPKPAIYLLLREMDPSRVDIPVQQVAWDEAGAPPEGALVIDMHQLPDYR